MPTLPTIPQALDLIRLWVNVYDHNSGGRPAPDESLEAVEQAINVLARQFIADARPGRLWQYPTSPDEFYDDWNRCHIITKKGTRCQNPIHYDQVWWWAGNIPVASDPDIYAVELGVCQFHVLRQAEKATP